MSEAVWWAVAVLMVIGMAGAALFVANKRGHVRRESMQSAATIAGPLGVVLSAAALIFAAIELSMEAKDDSDDGIRYGGTIWITDGRTWDLDGRPPAVEAEEGRNDLYFHNVPEGIGASGSAKIAAWSATDTPDREKCSALLSGKTPKEAGILGAPEVGDLFCVHTRNEKANSTHYAYGEVENVRPREYAVKTVVWKNP
ncbi:MAG: hypothetical protein ACRDT0_02020 [Pseudonocardiaceae bacterium]